jgi:hypothetical protein
VNEVLLPGRHFGSISSAVLVQMKGWQRSFHPSMKFSMAAMRPLVIEPSALARLGESLFYVELLAARKPDMAAASRLQQALIEGILP